MRIMASVGDAACQSQWAIAPQVDQNSVDGAPLLGSLPGPGRSQTQMWQGRYTINAGWNTIAFRIYTPCTLTVNQWSVRYAVTYP